MEHSELPEKWKTIPIKELFSFVLGGDWGKDPLKFEDKDYELALCIRGSEIKNWATKNSSTAVERLIKKTSLERRTLIPGDVLIEISGGGPDQPVGRTIYIDENSLINDKDIPLVCTNFLRMMRFHPKLNSKYIQQFLQLFYDSGSIIKYQGGSNNLRNLKFKDFETIKIPIAPRPEQDRIVAKVDSLMVQVETMQKSLERIPQLLEDFRKQVLNQSYSSKHKRIALEDCCYKIQDGAHHSPKEVFPLRGENMFPYVTSKNIRDNYMKLDTLTYVGQDYHNTIYPRCKPELGDVLLTKDGASTGNVTLNEFDEPVSLLSSVCLIKTDKTKLEPAYLKFFIQSPIGFSEFIGQMTGTAIKRVVLKKIKKATIPLPSIKEQQEIIGRVESLFAKATSIEKQYQSLKPKIDTLPQAILHKAFKGELVAQLASDGDARELLREIKGLKKLSKVQ